MTTRSVSELCSVSCPIDIEQPNIAVLTITPCRFLAQALQQSLVTWGFKVLGNYNDVDGAISARSSNTQTTIILVDSILVEQQVARCIEKLKRLVQDAKILVIAKVLANETKHEILGSGGHGYLETSRDEIYLKKAIEEVAIGGRWFERHVLLEAIEAWTLIGINLKTSIKKEYLEKLTRRERTVAWLVRSSLRNKEIARKLGISEQTVKLHLNNIFHKLGISSRLQLCTSLQESDPRFIP